MEDPVARKERGLQNRSTTELKDQSCALKTLSVAKLWKTEKSKRKKITIIWNLFYLWKIFEYLTILVNVKIILKCTKVNYKRRLLTEYVDYNGKLLGIWYFFVLFSF